MPINLIYTKGKIRHYEDITFVYQAPDISNLPSSSDLPEDVTSETNLKDLTVSDVQTYTCAISTVEPSSGNTKFTLKQAPGTSG